MHTHVPCVLPNASLQECLIAMTTGRIGMVVVKDAGLLAGLITDGDIRRGLLDGHLEGKCAIDIMTRNPLTIAENMPIAEAESVMRDKKVRVLLVGNQEHINGVLEIFD